MDLKGFLEVVRSSLVPVLVRARLELGENNCSGSDSEPSDTARSSVGRSGFRCATSGNPRTRASLTFKPDQRVG